MAWFGPRGDCGCCGTLEDCGCWNGYGDKPVLLLDVDVSGDWVDHTTCFVNEGDDTWVPYCRPVRATYGVNLVGSVSIPLRRICQGGASYLVIDASASYRLLEGSFSQVTWDHGFSCGGILYEFTDQYFIQVNPFANLVSVIVGAAGPVAWPAQFCQKSGSGVWSDQPLILTPPNPIQPGQCGDPVQVSDTVGSYSWEIVPGA